VENGATTIGLADTTGCLTPPEFGDMVARVRSWIPSTVTLSTHCHDDLGLSLANALAGIEAGADEVQATLAGIGERAGNTPLEELAAVLVYKGARMGASTRLKTEGLFETFEMLRQTINLERPRSKALFGDNAFTTQAGIHQAGMLRNPVTYEFAEPHRFGRQRSILVGRHSGRNVIRHVLAQAGHAADDELLEELYETFILGRSDGQCIEMSDLRQEVELRLAQRADAASPVRA
jgi:2-isopropylmalate synthase